MSPWLWEWWRFAWALNKGDRMNGWRCVVGRLHWREGGRP